MTPLYAIYFSSTYPNNTITYVFMFDVASNVKLGGELIKIHYPKLTVINVVEHTVSLFFNDVSKITIVDKMIIANNAIQNCFGCGINNKPHYIFKQKYYGFIIVILAYSEVIISGWLDISWEYTDTCTLDNNLFPQFRLHNSEV